MKTIIVSLVFAALFTQQAMAQDSPVSAGREAAARELVDTLNLERQMLAGATAMIDALVVQSPQLDAYRDVMLEWAKSVMTWKVFGPKFVGMYAEAFTEKELRDLIAFYRTPSGQKALTLLPELTSRAAKMGATEAQSHQGELQEMIRRRAAELRPSSSPQ